MYVLLIQSKILYNKINIYFVFNVASIPNPEIDLCLKYLAFCKIGVGEN